MTSTSEELESGIEDGYDSLAGEILADDGDVKAV
jgi:hypothetical protein